MLWYRRHLGDYARDAHHLTIFEHGAYAVLLDRYYTTEAALPADTINRLIGARTPEEQRVVARVLNEFFQLVDGKWIHKRVEREIAKRNKRVVQLTNAAHARWHAEPDATEHEDDDASRMHNASVLHADRSGNPLAHEPMSPEAKHAQSARRAGEASKAMRLAGCNSVNPAHPVLLQLLEAGATDEELCVAVAEALAKHVEHPFPYALAAVAGRRRNAPQKGLEARQSADRHAVSVLAPSLLPQPSEAVLRSDPSPLLSAKVSMPK